MTTPSRPPPHSRSRRIACLGALAAAAAAWARAPEAPPPAAEVPLGGVLPDVPMDGLNGPARRLGSWRGRPLVVNVWASWCGPCRAETASLERLAWLPTERPFAIIGVSTDDYRERALRWLQASRATLSHFIDHGLQLETLLGARQLPLTVLADAEGRVVQRVYGARAWDSAESQALVRRAFAAPAAARR
ncbi:MAG: TlpA disulfide reductase family protein [Rubrivivax sp.]